MQTIKERFIANVNNYDFSGEFMRPELCETSYLVDIGAEEIDKDAPYHIRLSAPGYLDCTDWSPVSGMDSLDDFFNVFCDHVPLAEGK